MSQLSLSRSHLHQIWLMSIPISILYVCFNHLIPFPFDYLCMIGGMMVMGNFHRISSHLASITRLHAGGYVANISQHRPNKPTVILYDIENCPECRMVREAISMLDIDAQIFPCPEPVASVSSPFREQLKQKLGDQFRLPYLIDPNGKQTDADNSDAHSIIRYLFSNYGREGNIQFPLSLESVGTLLSKIASKMRAYQPYGFKAVASCLPVQGLELFAYEECPYSRPVREILCSLQIPYTLRTCAQGSVTRPKLILSHRQLPIPLLHDPNTQLQFIGAEPCITYLLATYAVHDEVHSPPPHAACHTIYS